MNRKIYGNVIRKQCPVCNSMDIENVWKIPYKKLDIPITVRKHKLQLVPSYDYDVTYHYSVCNTCNSIFLNPYNHWSTTGSYDYVRKVKNREEWNNYAKRVERVLPFIKSFDFLIDAGCGGGQNLLIFKEKGIKWKREVAEEVNKPCIDYLKSLGYEGYCRGIEDKFPEIKEATADCVMFCEAFEHVESPFIAIKNMSGWLKVGGVLYLSAQAQEGDMFITAGESIATNFDAIKNVLNNFGLEIVFKLFTSGKWVVIGRKK